MKAQTGMDRYILVSKRRTKRMPQSLAGKLAKYYQNYGSNQKKFEPPKKVKCYAHQLKSSKDIT